MRKSTISIAILYILFSTSLLFSQITTPETFFGFKPGTDRMLFDYNQLINYLKRLDASSPRLKMIHIGNSSFSKPMYIAFISSEENIKNLDRLRTINRQLALDSNMSERQLIEFTKTGKVFFLATLSMHSSEVGPAQTAPLIAHDLVTTNDPEKLEWLNNVVYMMVPNHNPDGMDMIVNHYKKYKGTKYEDSSMPGVYHKYAGHNINRDFVTLAQEETKNISNIFSTQWYPQVMIEKHQMGSYSARYFVPPMHDPIAENVDADIWNWTKVFGSHMISDMTQAGLLGISQSYLFDDYWPGSTETCVWKNVIGMLTEAASVKLASPVFIEPNELKGFGKGLAEYKKSINMPAPWPGGWWRLGDIIQYEIESTMSILKTSSKYKSDILKFRNAICKKEVQKGQTKPPFYFIFPLEQHDRSELAHMVNLLKEHGVRVYQLTANLELNALSHKLGSVVVPLAQPFRAFVKEVIEKQYFPERHYTPNGELIKPYDITSWSLPLHRGLDFKEVNERFDLLENSLAEITGDFTLKNSLANRTTRALYPSFFNDSYKAAFTALGQGLKVERLLEDLPNFQSEKGSFLISGSTGRLGAIENKLAISPHYLEARPSVKSRPLKIPRIALVETPFHDMDAGWTRFIFDNYSIPFKVLNPGDFKSVSLSQQFDLIIFPDVDKNILMEGKYKSSDGTYNISSYPPEFTKGLGKEGLKKLLLFIENGGIIVSWGRSTNLFMGPQTIERSSIDKEEFQLPISDVSKNLAKAGLFCPGSLLKINLTLGHPLTLGMQESVGVFFRGRPVFQTSIPNFDMDRRVIGTFPERDIIVSGYCEKSEQLANKTLFAWLKKGKGQIVMFGFNPQFRASTQSSFKLLFNSILLEKLK
jgi:hypothetical protein